MTTILDTVLLLALPASGKSEVRTFLSTLSERQCRDEFNMGPTLQLDDYPYVHFMHVIDDQLKAHGLPYVFYGGPDRPFRNDFEWGTLIHLLNEDYDDLLGQRTTEPASAAQLLFDRIDAAREKAGLPPSLGEIPHRIRCTICDAMEAEVRAELTRKNETCRQDRTGKTIVIEFARGGPNGSAFPLTPPHGYAFSLGALSDAILSRSSILYIWVTQEESRRKNVERGIPSEQGSILHHSVPLVVMLSQYGCDDIDYLLSQSGKADTIIVERIAQVGDRYEMRHFDLPLARFDNRDDLTSFVREAPRDWEPAEREALHNGLKHALNRLAELQQP